MLISRVVTVKSRVTPALKAQLGAETQKALREVEHEIERALAEIGRRRAAGRTTDEVSSLESEARELAARKDALVAKIRDIAKLREGQEVTRGQIQGFYEVKVGDVWSETQSSDVVLEDGKVIAIREGTAVTVSVSASETQQEEDGR